MKQTVLVSLLCILIFCASCSGAETATREYDNLVSESENHSKPHNYAKLESSELPMYPQSTPEPAEVATETDKEPYAFAEIEIDPTDFTGIWHIAPGPGDAYGERYYFADDGTFIFIRTDTDAAARERAFSGTWESAEGQVVITVKNKIIHIGGDPFPPFAGVGSDYEIIGGRTVYTQGDYETRVYEISDVFIDRNPSSPIRSVYINGCLYRDFNQLLKHYEWISLDDVLTAYTRFRDAVPSSVADTFDYSAAADFNAVYITEERTEREDIFSLPYVMAGGRKHHVQVVKADMTGNGALETITIYYEVTTNAQGEEVINAIRTMIDNGERHNTFRTFVSGSTQRKSMYFADLHGDGRLSLIWQDTPHFGSTDIITYNETGLRRYSVFGEMKAWDEGRIYTAFSRLMDNDNTVVSYFDLERGLVPFETERVAGKEISFPFVVPLLTAKPDSSPCPRFFPDAGTTIERLQEHYRKNLLATVPANEMLTIIDVQFLLREDRYEVFPWIKLETANGSRGWIRMLDN
jgi:hypothetical protein